jgi:TRAP-type C4-dicarboxylate transport system substrate-binding protein
MDAQPELFHTALCKIFHMEVKLSCPLLRENYMRRLQTIAGAIAITCAAAAAQAEQLRMISAFAENFIWTREIAQPFIELVEEESEGALSISMTGPDAVPLLEQFEPTQAGVFDILFTHPAYHAGITPVGLAIDAVSVDPLARRAAGLIDYIDNHYSQFGMKLVAAPAVGSKGFRYYLKRPLSGTPGFQGLKIRGTVSYHKMIEALGGSPVVMGGADVYSALQTGVVDGAAWPLTGAKDFKWYEVSNYLADPIFGQVGLMIFVNQDVWNSLTDQEQSAMERAASRLEALTVERFDVLAALEKQELLDRGMQMTAFAEEEASQFETLWSNGVWDVAREKGYPEVVDGLRALAVEAGLTE